MGRSTLTRARSVIYTLDNANHQELAEGETYTDSFTVTVSDEHGASATATVTITITGSNDGPVIEGAWDLDRLGAGRRDAERVWSEIDTSNIDLGAVLTYAETTPGPMGRSTLTRARERGPTRWTMPTTRSWPRARLTPTASR